MARKEPSVSHSEAGYFSNIDVLRGVAVLMVLWYHAPFVFSTSLGFPQEIVSGTFSRIFWTMSAGGWIGVDLFFVVSGFLITSLLLRSHEAGSPLAVFWYHRALRILPLALLYLSLLGINAGLHNPLGILKSFDGWWAYLSYVGNFHIALNGWQPLAVMILWSLAVEQQFYLFWPVLIYRMKRRQLLLLVAMVIALSPLARAIVYLLFDYPAVYVLTFCRLDGLASGAMLAFLFTDEVLKSRTIASTKKLAPLAWIVVGLTFIAPFSPSFPSTRPLLFTLFGYTWIAISFAVLVGASFDRRPMVGSYVLRTALNFVGKRCYGFYLWHVLVAAAVAKCLDAWSLDVGFYGQISLWLTVLCVVAAISWSFFERAFLALRHAGPGQFRLSLTPDPRAFRLWEHRPVLAGRPVSIMRDSFRRNRLMKTCLLCLVLVPWSSLCLAESQPTPAAQNEEPKLFDHYLAMQQMQMKLGQRTFDEQQRLQPQMHRAELAACQRLKKDRDEGVSGEVYREQGGAQFYAFVQDFERYCQTLSP